jgi:site-specific DNA recombinase
VGEIRHKRVSHPGHHEPIIERAQWRRVQEMLKNRATRQGGDTSRRTPSFLMGKVFDENGEPLYACWSKKGNRRYRYFVSRKLVRGADKTRDGGWRISAEEIEHAAMAAARQMLSDRGALASTLKACGLSAAELKQALEVVDRRIKLVDEIAAMDLIGSLIGRVELNNDGMQITLDLRGLLPTELVSDGARSLRMTRVVHMQMKRRGVETRLVIPGEAVAVCRCDPALLRALSRGFHWFGELASGRAASTRQIAAREGLSHSYVRHVVPLGLLAPKLMEAICAGQQSVIISAERLKDHARFPIEWDAQQRLLSD